MKLLDGKKLSQEVRTRTKEAVDASGIEPGLASIMVGSHEASAVYLRMKAKAAVETGIRFERIEVPHAAMTEDVVAVIEGLNARADVHGILVQLPLPEGFDTDTVIRAIDPAKDVDGFHPENLTAIERGEERRLPVLVKAVMALLEAAGTTYDGRVVVILSANDVFIRPFRSVFERRGATVEQSDVLEPTLTRRADILLTAMSKPHTINAEHIQEGATLIDISTTPTDHGLAGDVDAESVATKASCLSPVPGGVGPMTVAFLMENTALAAGVRFTAT